MTKSAGRHGWRNGVAKVEVGLAQSSGFEAGKRGA